MLAAGAGRSAQQTRREQLGGEGNEQFVSCSPGTTGVQGRVGVLGEHWTAQSEVPSSTTAMAWYYGGVMKTYHE